MVWDRPYHPGEDPEDPLDYVTGYPKPGYWEWQHVLRALKEAMDILHRMPMPSNGQPIGYRSGMPDHLRTYIESYDSMAARSTVNRPVRPTAKEIAWMDVVLSWLSWLNSGREMKVVTGMAIGAHYRAIGRAVGCHHDLAKREGETGLKRIAKRLNEGVDSVERNERKG